MFSNCIRILAGFSLLFVAACQPDGLTPQNQDYRQGVLVVNEGPFQTGSGTLSFAHFARTAGDSNYAFSSAFDAVNGRPLGSLAQSAIRVSGKLLVAVHLAGTVEVMDAKTLVSEFTFTGLGLPRFFQDLGNDRVAVSDWQDNRVYILDLKENAVADTLVTDPGPEGMAWLPTSSAGPVLLVACSGGFGQNNTVAVFNSALERIQTWTVGDQPHSFAKDPSGVWWLLNQGTANWTTPQLGTPGTVYRIDPQTLTATLWSTATDVTLHPSHLVCDGTGLVFLSDRYAGKAVRMPLASNVWPTTVFLPQTLYSLAFDAQRQEFYGGRITDYSEPGQLIRYRSNGAVLDSLPVGIVPGFILPE
jgi:DNA-binding beta-propeller fold protein YncE